LGTLQFLQKIYYPYFKKVNIMTLEAIITLSIAVFGLAIKPGPGMMLVMSRTIAQGMKACFTFLIGFLFISVP